MGLLKGRAFRHTNRSESKNGVAIMTAHAVKLHGWIRAVERKDAVTRAFGPGYYELLNQWAPVGVSAIQLARQLTAHAKNFDMPLPAGLATDTTTVDPTIRLHMIVKLIDREMQHLRIWHR
jgi:hypothetical protein